LLAPASERAVAAKPAAVPGTSSKRLERSAWCRGLPVIVATEANGRRVAAQGTTMNDPGTYCRKRARWGRSLSEVVAAPAEQRLAAADAAGVPCPRIDATPSPDSATATHARRASRASVAAAAAVLGVALSIDTGCTTNRVRLGAKARVRSSGVGARLPGRAGRGKALVHIRTGLAVAAVAWPAGAAETARRVGADGVCAAIVCAGCALVDVDADAHTLGVSRGTRASTVSANLIGATSDPTLAAVPSVAPDVHAIRSAVLRRRVAAAQVRATQVGAGLARRARRREAFVDVDAMPRDRFVARRALQLWPRAVGLFLVVGKAAVGSEIAVAFGAERGRARCAAHDDGHAAELVGSDTPLREAAAEA